MTEHSTASKTKNCPNCKTANPAEASFCFNCGASFPPSCTNCGTTLQNNAKFCHNCGQPTSIGETNSPPQTEMKPADKQTFPASQPTEQGDLLQRYIPRELLTKLEAAHQSRIMEGERRIVSILFCDVKGSSLAASRLDPEEWAEIINGAFENMIQPVYKYEGIVARLLGDGLLAFFGAPIAHEDDPQRAIFAGLDIVAAIQEYREEVKSRWDIDFDVRVGVNTGLVVVGAIGSDLHMEYSAVGDAINMAARMEQTAQPGTVQVAEPTYKLVAPLFDFEPIEDLHVKGREGSVTGYQVLGRKTRPGSLRGIAGLSSPLIGRKSEMDALQSSISQLKDGAGQVISVIGEAGLGKSRLIAEFHQNILADDVAWLEGRSLSYQANTPYAPFIDLFGEYFALDPESVENRYEKLRARIDEVLPDQGEEIAPFFATMLGITLKDSDLDRVRYLEPPLLRGTIFSHVALLLEGLMVSRPLVLYLDDLHWADPTSLELLASMLPLTDRLPFMILSAFRPRQGESSWQFHEKAESDFSHRYRSIKLKQLDKGRSRELVANLLHIEDLPEKVRSKILEKSEGNPFFVEEIIRSLLDEGLVVRVDGHWQATREIHKIDLPNTLVGVITSRLDRLDNTTRHILQASAVLGREFNHDILAEIVERPDQIDASLVELQRRDLLREKKLHPVRSYAFKHVLTHEAAYKSILLSNRRYLHGQAAEVMIARYPEASADIARHLIDARQEVRAVPFLVQAGDKAARAYSSEEAIGYYSQAIEQREKVKEPGLVRRAYEGLGRAYSLANSIPEAEGTFQEMLDLAMNSQDVPMQISAFNKLAGIRGLQMGQFQEADELLAQAKSLSYMHSEKSCIPETALITCQMSTVKADFDSVVDHMSEVIEVGKELGGTHDVVMGLGHIANSLNYLTKFDEAFENAQEALRIARQIGDREHEAHMLSEAIPIYYMRNGDFAAARKYLLDGLALSQKIGILHIQTIAAYLFAEIDRYQGQYERALEYGQLSLQAALPLEDHMPFMLVPALGSLGSIYLEISEEFKDKISEFHLHALRILENPAGMVTGGIAWADLSHCAITLGDLKIAEESVQKGLNYPNMFMYIERPRQLSGAALLAKERGEHEEALRLANEAKEYAEARGMRYLYPLTALILGKVLIGSDQIDAGLLALEKAEAEAMDLQMRPIIWQSRVEAANTLSKLGRTEEANAKREAAREMVSEIAGLFEDQELREAFLRNAEAKIAPKVHKIA